MPCSVRTTGRPVSSDARAAREGVSYSYWRFRKNILLPSEVKADSMVVYFHEGLLVVSFAK